MDIKYPGYVVSAILLDRVITTPFWHLEANPILLEIGIIGMWLTALILIPIFIYLYAITYKSFPKTANSICIILGSFYYIVILMNIRLILSLYVL